MLRETFLHVPHLGPDTERRLWREGVGDWDEALRRCAELSLGAADAAVFRRTLESSRRALDSRDHRYFERCLGVREAWRAFPDFRDDAVYLDIETDGGRGPGAITTIGMHSRHGFVALVRGRDLDRFPQEIARFAMIVTFFGTGFDVPILKSRFRDVPFDQIHLDLCPTFRRVGVHGGLKKIERALGLARGVETDGLTGWDAVKLWRRHEAGDPTALETLVAYNRDDVVNLEPLAEIAYAKLRSAARGEPILPATV